MALDDKTLQNLASQLGISRNAGVGQVEKQLRAYEKKSLKSWLQSCGSCNTS